jgi:triosephosphate isomerase
MYFRCTGLFFGKLQDRLLGQISSEMIFNARARYVIVGHSERRELGETNEIVNKKLKRFYSIHYL